MTTQTETRDDAQNETTNDDKARAFEARERVKEANVPEGVVDRVWELSDPQEVIQLAEQYVDDFGDATPNVGQRFLDASFGKFRTVESVAHGKGYVTTLHMDDGTNYDLERFNERREAGEIIRAPEDEHVTELTNRYLDAQGEDMDAFELAQTAAYNEPEDNRLKIRFVGVRDDDGVHFDFDTGIASWYEPDKIVANHYDMTDDMQQVFDFLRSEIDLRKIKGGSRYGAVTIDMETGEVTNVSFHAFSLDVNKGRMESTIRGMLE